MRCSLVRLLCGGLDRFLCGGFIRLLCGGLVRLLCGELVDLDLLDSVKGKDIRNTSVKEPEK